MKKFLLIVSAVALLVAVLAPSASAASHKREPFMPTKYAKHESWDLAQDWAEANEDSDTSSTDTDISCKRVRRSTVDCKTRVTFTEITDYENEKEEDFHAWWTLRFRAGQAMYTVHYDRYFLGDRYATLDPTDDKFGGLALHTDYDLSSDNDDSDGESTW